MKTAQLHRACVGIGFAAVMVLGSEGCATRSAFDRFMGADLYEEAALAFQQDSTLWNDSEALLSAGQLFANPSLSVHDPAQARRVLERLVSAFPRTAEARQGGVVLALLTQMERGERELAALTTELHDRIAQADTLAASRKAAEGEIQALRRAVARLEADLENARQELERLKAIDLGRPPPDVSSSRRSR